MTARAAAALVGRGIARRVLNVFDPRSWLPTGGVDVPRVALGYARLVSGAYLLLGALGLMVTGTDHFSNVTGVSFLEFTINPLTNLIHLGVGLVGVAMGATLAGSRRFLLLIGFLGVPFAVAGLLLDGTLSDFFAANPRLNWVHLVTAVVALGLGLLSRRR